MTSTHATYIGRFAPSPTGALHFGSLLAALASYLDAHHHQGRWLVRMEDLDPPREQPGAADQILRTLERFQLHWHGEVRYQSQRHESYQAIIGQLLSCHHAYRCDCSRQQIAQRSPAPYDGHCRERQGQTQEPTAIRVAVTDTLLRFDDRIQGSQHPRLVANQDDFVVFRRDGYYAYQLAVVIDDFAQGVTDVVRGYDLLDSTPRQLYLQQLLGYPSPRYAHIPVMVNPQGQKLSKQTFATALDERHPEIALYTALEVLGQRPPKQLRGAAAPELLSWATAHWRCEKVPAVSNVPECTLEVAH